MGQNIPSQLLFRRIDLSAGPLQSSSTRNPMSNHANDTDSTFSSSSQTSPFSSSFVSPLCNDGSIPSIYYRNCSANWDRRPGDPDFCNVTIKRWILDFSVTNRDYLSNGLDNNPMMTSELFLSNIDTLIDGLYCYDQDSCLQRSTNLTTSHNLPLLAFPSGIALPYAEANPNLYKSHHVVIPYCTSDLYMGTHNNITFGNGTWYFHGYDLIFKVIDTLFYDLPTLVSSSSIMTNEDSLVSADEIILIGPLGLQVHLPEIISYITAIKRNITGNQSAIVQISTICDGCALMGDIPLFDNTTNNDNTQYTNCTSDSNCPYSVSLPLVTSSIWNYTDIPVWCDRSALSFSYGLENGWKCLTAEYLLPNLTSYMAQNRPIFGNVQLFFHLPQYDIVNMLAYNVWPAANSSQNSSAKIWSENIYAFSVRNLLETLTVMFNSVINVQIYSSAFILPSPSLSLSPLYYSQSTNCTDIQGYHYKDSMNEAISSLIIDAGQDRLQCIDNCSEINCGDQRETLP